MFIILMLLAAIVLVVIADLTLKPTPWEVANLPDVPVDRHVSRRLAVLAVAALLLLVAGLVAAYLAHPDAFRTAVSRPLNSVLRRYYWVMFSGVALYLIVRLCGVKHGQAVWLFCLSLPGSLTMPVMLVAALLAGTNDGMAEVLFELMIHPATWLLPIIALTQWRLLRKPRSKHLLAGLARTFLVVAAYLCTTFV
jgi:hypothetical protein